MAEKLIYVVEDDNNIQELIIYNLQRNGFAVRAYSNGNDMLADCSHTFPHLFILDLMLPGMDGLDICKELRSSPQTRTIPIIILTALSSESDKVIGLELGADDYITKPFSVREFIARVKAAVRRYERQDDDSAAVLSLGALLIDCANRSVQLHGKDVELSYKEFELLHILAVNNKKVLTRELLLEKVWSMDFMGETRTIDVHIRYLRQKLAPTDYIETVRGVGYRLCVKEEKDE